jgi:hypothetical protein
MKNIDLTVMLLDKDDSLTKPSTWKLPSFFGKGASYVVKIPYTFITKAKDDIRFEHLAIHEIGHIVIGGLGTYSNEDEVETERKVEYLVYLIAGKTKYEEFIRSWMMEQDPKQSKAVLDNTMSNWMLYIGIKD